MSKIKRKRKYHIYLQLYIEIKIINYSDRESSVE